MALAGYEWIIVAGVLIVFFLWGPNKIPDLARAVGQAKREFDRASKEITSPYPSETPASGPGSGATWTASPAPATAGGDDALINTAKKLGIVTEGRTRDEISNEILLLSNDNKPLPPPAPPATLKKKE